MSTVEHTASPQRNDPALDLRSVDLGEHGALKVLVADDDRDSREALGLLLELEGHAVRYARDGDEALRVAKSARPDVVLLDITMPGKDGYEVCRRLRHSSPPGTRIFAVSALSGKAHRQRCNDAGFDSALVKPLDPMELTRLLRRLNG